MSDHADNADSRIYRTIAAMAKEHVSFLLVTEGSHHADDGCEGTASDNLGLD